MSRIQRNSLGWHSHTSRVDVFTCHHQNRLTQSVVGGVTSSSAYDGDGLRMSHTVDSVTTQYTWDAVPPAAAVGRLAPALLSWSYAVRRSICTGGNCR